MLHYAVIRSFLLNTGELQGESASSVSASNIIQFIIAAALIIIAFKLAKSIAKPILYGIVIVAVLLIVWGVVDISTVKEKGEELADGAWSCAGEQVRQSDAGQNYLA